ncbi:MAG: selenium cofactor biosynthesis protein YqeC [Acidimicrobiia bacterium]|nr:selenium cofactor biosynthesis protein YqeC [Acidimicrobiia bacterium]
MTLADRMGLGSRELVSLVGGGGKSTLLFLLGGELAAGGRRVVLTTTTKMGRRQIHEVPNICESVESAAQGSGESGPIMLVTGGDAHKVTGPSPEELDSLFGGGSVDYLIVEADGAHGRSLKAPALHEPVIPSASTTVVIAMGIDAIGRRLDEATHRVEKAMEFSGLSKAHILAPADCVEILVHPGGALRAVPQDARVLVALTKVRPGADDAAVDEIAGLLRDHGRFDGVVTTEVR